MFVYGRYCSNNTLSFTEWLKDDVSMMLINLWHPWNVALGNSGTSVCGHACSSFFTFYFWMRCQPWAHETNMAHFPFLWTIGLPLPGRLMEGGLLDQCHHASSMSKSSSTTLLLPFGFRLSTSSNSTCTFINSTTHHSHSFSHHSSLCSLCFSERGAH